MFLADVFFLKQSFLKYFSMLQILRRVKNIFYLTSYLKIMSLD